jgi:glyoxylase-like metal-dependent hydrolase (beta-lactamase superfamily II)
MIESARVARGFALTVAKGLPQAFWLEGGSASTSRGGARGLLTFWTMTASRTSGVAHAGTAIANTWLVTDADGRRVLVDTGHRTERLLLLRGLGGLGVRRRGDLTAVLLTHRHCDHAGNADFLRERFGCEILCHAEDRPLLEGERAPARLAGRGAPSLFDVLARFEDAFPAKARVDRVVKDGEVVHGIEVAHVGGHTEGSVLLYHRESGTLFTGDALLSGLPVQHRVRLHLAYSAFSVDARVCRDNTRRYLRACAPATARSWSIGSTSASIASRGDAPRGDAPKRVAAAPPTPPSRKPSHPFARGRNQEAITVDLTEATVHIASARAVTPAR